MKLKIFIPLSLTILSITATGSDPNSNFGYINELQSFQHSAISTEDQEFIDLVGGYIHTPEELKQDNDLIENLLSIDSNSPERSPFEPTSLELSPSGSISLRSKSPSPVLSNINNDSEEDSEDSVFQSVFGKDSEEESPAKNLSTPTKRKLKRKEIENIKSKHQKMKIRKKDITNSQDIIYVKDELDFNINDKKGTRVNKVGKRGIEKEAYLKIVNFTNQTLGNTDRQKNKEFISEFIREESKSDKKSKISKNTLSGNINQLRKILMALSCLRFEMNEVIINKFKGVDKRAEILLSEIDRNLSSPTNKTCLKSNHEMEKLIATFLTYGKKVSIHNLEDKKVPKKDNYAMRFINHMEKLFIYFGFKHVESQYPPVKDIIKEEN